MSTERYSGVSLDAAGTLIVPAQPVGQTYSELAAAAGLDVDPDAVSQAFRAEFPRMPPLAFPRLAGTALTAAEHAWWRDLVARCLPAASRQPSFAAFFDALYDHYASAGAWRLFEDVVPFLDALQGRELAVVITSNFDSRLHAVLRGLGVWTRFQDVICSSSAGSAKPDGAIFALACAALDQPAARVLHIGDDARADVDGAERAGLGARRIVRESTPPGALSDLRDALMLLRPRRRAGPSEDLT